jgi:tetratricopeptide (TPR) repeat protein
MRQWPRLPRPLGLTVLLAALVVARPYATSTSTTTLLDRYSAGHFAEVIGTITRDNNYDDLLKNLTKAAPAWIDAGGPADRSRRQLAAATLALEAARAGTFDEWKLVQNFIRLEYIYWKAPPKLIEWGCQILRQAGPPSESERLWHLAALAVAARAGDFEFLIGSPWEARANPWDELLHLEHSAERFPHERRFALAQGIAAEWRLFPSPRSGATEAQKIFEMLSLETEVGPEAGVRLGFMMLRAGNLAGALTTLASAAARSSDPYATYLAHYFRAKVFERQRQPSEAETAYREALAVIPAAQSSSFGLAALLAARGKRAEASALVDAALMADPRPVDPWRAYGEADARFWPELITRLHAEIRR